MKATNHNGRSGKHGAYNPKHNDRQFDVAKSDHIDAVRMLENVNWDYQRGIRLFKQENDDGISFETVELDYYEENFGEYIRNQNARNEQNRHPERNRTIEDMYKDTKTCPEETLWQIGNREESVDAEMLQTIVQEFLEERDKQFGSHVVTLDWALHNDESTPHIHERHVFQCRNKYGEMCPQQERALEELGIPLPNLDKPKGRNNNRKMTFDATCRRMFIGICKKYGIEVDEIPVYGGEKYLEKNDFIIKKQREELAEQSQQLTRNGNLIIRGKRKIDEVTEKAKSAEAELKAKDAEVQHKREELQTASVELAWKKAELADAKDELSDAKRKLKQAETQLAGANSEIAEVEKELQDTYADIDNADEVLAIKKQDIQEQDKKLKLVRSKVEEADELVNNICEIAYQIAFEDISGKAAELVRSENRKRINAYNELMEETPMSYSTRSFFESVMKRIVEIIEKPIKNFSEALHERLQWSRSVHMDDIQDRVWNHIETKAEEQERMGKEESLVVNLARNKRRGR